MAETPRDSTPGEPTSNTGEPARGTRRPFPPRSREIGIDALIGEAIRRGDFDDLPGAGKPLPRDEGAHAGEWGLAFHVLKQAGEAPLWIALGKEIEDGRVRLRSLLERATERGRTAMESLSPEELTRLRAERGLLRSEYLEQAAALDEKLGRYSLLVPISRLEKGRLPRHIAAAQFESAWPEIGD